MSKLSSISGTATAIRALLYIPEAFPSLEQVNIMEGDVAGTQEALPLISHIPTAYYLCLRLQDLNEWLQFKFPRRKVVEMAESLLKTITDLSMRGISSVDCRRHACCCGFTSQFEAVSYILTLGHRRERYSRFCQKDESCLPRFGDCPCGLV